MKGHNSGSNVVRDNSTQKGGGTANQSAVSGRPTNKPTSSSTSNNDKPTLAQNDHTFGEVKSPRFLEKIMPDIIRGQSVATNKRTRKAASNKTRQNTINENKQERFTPASGVKMRDK